VQNANKNASSLSQDVYDNSLKMEGVLEIDLTRNVKSVKVEAMANTRAYTCSGMMICGD
jgi:hypothetical protein